MRRLGRVAVLVSTRRSRDFTRVRSDGCAGSASCRTPTPCTTTRRRVGGRRSWTRSPTACPPATGSGDGAALHFVGTELAEVVSSRPVSQARYACVDDCGDSRRGGVDGPLSGGAGTVAARRLSATSMMQDRRQILAMGGGGFTMESTLALDRFALELTGKPVPRICFLPTASGDPREQATRFHERFSSWPCEPSILSLFHLGRDRIDPRDAPAGPGRDLRRRWLDAQHAGGVARALGRRDHARRLGARDRAGGAERGGDVLVRGRDHDERRVRRRPPTGSAWSSGSLSVHMDGEPERLPVFRQAIATGRLPGGVRRRRRRGAPAAREPNWSAASRPAPAPGSCRCRPTAKGGRSSASCR